MRRDPRFRGSESSSDWLRKWEIRQDAMAGGSETRPDDEWYAMMRWPGSKPRPYKDKQDYGYVKDKGEYEYGTRPKGGQ
jgi:hypothetical protein